MTNYIVTRYIVIFKLYSVKKFPGRFGITKPRPNVPLGYDPFRDGGFSSPKAAFLHVKRRVRSHRDRPNKRKPSFYAYRNPIRNIEC